MADKIETTAAVMCVGCGLTFRRQAGECPTCFPQRGPDAIRCTTHVAPSVPAAASGHLFYWNRRNMERWRQTHLPDAQALRNRIIALLAKEPAT